MSEDVTSDDIKKAFDRIARTYDGQMVYRYLQKIRLGLTPLEASECALQRNEGSRTLAADLMGFMYEGIADSDRYAITFAVAKPIELRATRGAARRIGPEHYVPGWDGPGDAADAGAESSNDAGATFREPTS
jgi:hypothetical protein